MTSVFPYHPDYGVPDYFRLRALRDAETLGMQAAAARNRVHISTLYAWKAALRPSQKADTAKPCNTSHSK